jgi:hypothetical protein
MGPMTYTGPLFFWSVVAVVVLLGVAWVALGERRDRNARTMDRRPMRGGLR